MYATLKVTLCICLCVLSQILGADTKQPDAIGKPSKNNFVPTGGRGSDPEVHKVPEHANLVRRFFLKISLLAENVDENPRVKNTESLVSHVYFILPENVLYTLFSQKQPILAEHFL